MSRSDRQARAEARQAGARRKSWARLPEGIDPVIFPCSLLLMALLLLAVAIDQPLAARLLLGLQDVIAAQFGWLFVLTVSGLLAFALWLALSRHGQWRLGGARSRPDFSFGAWLAMLLSAGMGIGLVFFGVAEPVLHYLDPRVAEPQSVAAAREAMRLSLFHWGLHAWGIYAVLALALAHAHFDRGEPLALRSTLQPLLGARTHRWPGKLFDVLAVLGTLFGLATSLGLGAAQISAGLERLFGLDRGLSSQLWIIVLVTACAITSLLLGLDKGIRRLSEFNLGLAALLLFFVLLAGPTSALLRGLPDHLGSYLQGLPGLSLRTDPFRDLDWQKAWTVFYWAWWLSWAPFVSTFIARISRGRTVREFLLGVLLLPTLMGLLWFGVLGGAALRVELFEGGGIGAVVQEDAALAVFALLEGLPLAFLSSLLAVILVGVFFVTSSDSGSYVVDMLASGGHTHPPVWQRVFWGVVEGVLAMVLLLLGGLQALQAGAISLGLPICLAMPLVAWCLLRNLRAAARHPAGEPLSVQAPPVEAPQSRAAASRSVTSDTGTPMR